MFILGTMKITIWEQLQTLFIYVRCQEKLKTQKKEFVGNMIFHHKITYFLYRKYEDEFQRKHSDGKSNIAKAALAIDAPKLFGTFSPKFDRNIFRSLSNFILLTKFFNASSLKKHSISNAFLLFWKKVIKVIIICDLQFRT